MEEQNQAGMGGVTEMSTDSKYFWPEVFNDKTLIKGRDPRALLSDGLSAWAVVMCGDKIPEKFGETLAEIGKEIDCSDVTAEGLSKFGKEKGWIK